MKPMTKINFPRTDDALRANRISGPTGRPLGREDLPARNTTRWVARRKAEVVAGVRAGLITMEEARRRYALSRDEFLSWQQMFDEHGLRGLRATRTKGLRQ
jgi:hypothetical protein|tara:strand:- start:73 stop:375 length:303 start_codon:yes stop_codon:yes gene_type:complete